MPKMKTKSAAKKRFQVTGGGHLKRKQPRRARRENVISITPPSSSVLMRKS